MTTTPRVKAALFDLDGTLVDSLPTIAEAMAEAARMHGLDASAEQIIPFIGAPMNILVEEIYGVSAEVADAVNEDYVRVYHADYIQKTPPHEGAGNLLAALRAAGVRLAVVTNKRDEGAHLMTDIQGWRGHFEVIHGRESGAPKPLPEAALAALRKLDVQPADAAFVGDTEFDMICARDAGVGVIIGLVGSRDAAHLRADGATHIVHSLAEVAPLLLAAEVAP